MLGKRGHPRERMFRPLKLNGKEPVGRLDVQLQRAGAAAVHPRDDIR
jgi:hypothetical protein